MTHPDLIMSAGIAGTPRRAGEPLRALGERVVAMLRAKESYDWSDTDYQLHAWAEELGIEVEPKGK